MPDEIPPPPIPELQRRPVEPEQQDNDAADDGGTVDGWVVGNGQAAQRTRRWLGRTILLVSLLFWYAFQVAAPLVGICGVISLQVPFWYAIYSVSVSVFSGYAPIMLPTDLSFAQSAARGVITEEKLFADLGGDGYFDDIFQKLKENYTENDAVQIMLNMIGIWMADGNLMRPGYGWTALAKGARLGDHESVKELLDLDVDPNQKGPPAGSTALHIGAKFGHEYDKVVKVLLDHGADVNHQDHQGKTPLFKAAQAGYTAVVEVLLDHGADMNIKNFGRIREPALFTTAFREPALFTAAAEGYAGVVDAFLEHGADVGGVDELGQTILHRAAVFGHVSVVKVLLKNGVLRKNGVSLSDKDSRGSTALQLAVENNEILVLKVILESIAPRWRRFILSEKNMRGETVLHFAARTGRLEAVKILLKSYADVINQKDDKGNTGLHIAARRGHEAIVDTLLKSGADLREKTNKGNTGLHIAARRGHGTIFEKMIQHGADPRIMNHDGQTVLDYITTWGSDVFFKTMIASTSTCRVTI